MIKVDKYITTNHLLSAALAGGLASLAGLGLIMMKQRGFSSAAAQAGPTVVATVDGVAIPVNLYRAYLKDGSEALPIDQDSNEGRRQVALLRDGILAELIDRALVEAEARRRNLLVRDDELSPAYQHMIARMGGRESYDDYLRRHGLTDAEFRATVAQILCGERVKADLTKDITIAEAEVKAFYDQEQANPELAHLFSVPEQVRAQHILIAARPAQIAAQFQARGPLPGAELDQLVADERRRRREQAGVIMSKVRGGASFAQLAREYSDDPATRARGGDLGLFTRNTHTAPFDRAAFALKPGQTSDVVETEYGYHIIRVTEHTPERRRSLGELRPVIHDHLLARKRAGRLDGWLKERRRVAAILIDPFFAGQPPGLVQQYFPR